MNSSGAVCANAKLKRRTYARSIAKTREQLQLLAQRRQPRRRLIRRKKFARMRLECHHARRQAEFVRRLGETREHRLMAEMHAIEITDGQCNRAGGDSGRVRKTRIKRQNPS